MQPFTYLFALTAFLLLPFPVTAKPNLAEKADFSVLTRSSSHYQFQTLLFHSKDGERHYRIYVGIPKTPVPKGGFPTLYLLDGNAALAEMHEDRLSALALNHPYVLVLLGFDSDKRILANERAWDYTPPSLDGRPIFETEKNRKNGGAEEFSALLLNEIRPKIADLAPLNPDRQMLWGHSYGGLFVLHTLFNHPQAFSHYLAADPSLWWHDGQILREADHFSQKLLENKPILQLHFSGKPSTSPPPQLKQNSISRDEAIRQFKALLPTLPIKVQLIDFPDDSHGSLLSHSLQTILATLAKD